jgi:folate-binding protein YgfZ
MFSLDGYRAVHSNGGVVRRTDLGVLAVAGADRATWLQGLLTNDVLALADGESCYSAYLTPKGRMITDMTVLAQGNRLLLAVPARLAAALCALLDSLIFSEDVQVSDESGRLSVWTVVTAQGFREVFADTLPSQYASLPSIDLDTFEVIRIERGVPKFLVDMDEDTIPLEAGIEDRAISFTKGCYVGQEIIVRVTTRGGGRVARKLVHWRADAPAFDVPFESAVLKSGDREIGRVTSATFSPSLNTVVGLGYVHRDFVERGTKVTAVWDDARLEVTVL